MHREANFDKVAAELRKMGLEADNAHTGGGVYCVLVHLSDDTEIYFGTAGDTWAAAVLFNDEYTGMDLWTECPSSRTDPKFVAKELYFSVVKFVIGQ